MSLDITITAVRPVAVFEDNITHNFRTIAGYVDLYFPLWHPEQLVPSVSKAGDLIPYLKIGLEKLKVEHQDRFKRGDGWKESQHLLYFTKKYLKSCEEFPDGEIRVSA